MDAVTKSTNSQLERLKAQQGKLANKIHKLEALEKQRKRKQEVIKQRLVGAYFLQEAAKNGTETELRDKLDTFLTRDIDRALFDLHPLEKN